MCIHGQEYETCRFGCTFRKKEELRLENDKIQAENEKLKEFIETLKPMKPDVYKRYVEYRQGKEE